MKRSSRTLLVYGVVAGLAALVIYDQSVSAGAGELLAGWTPFHLAPGTATNVPAPTNGQVSFVLPANAHGWVQANRSILSASSATSPQKIAVPGAPALPLYAAGVGGGSVFALQWVDETGTVQAAFVGFVPAAGVA